MTRNLKLFALFSLVWSAGFFSVLHWALFDSEKWWPLIAIAASIYGMGEFVGGRILGRSDAQRAVRYDLDFRYGLVSMLISFVVGGMWIVLFRPTEWLSLLLFIAIAAVIQTMHFYSSRRSVKGIDHKQLFK